MKVLVTGSSGLIGSEAVTFFDGQGHDVIGVDNNMRAVFWAGRATLRGTAGCSHRHVTSDISISTFAIARQFSNSLVSISSTPLFTAQHNRRMIGRLRSR